MYSLISQNIQYLHGVGPHRAALLNKELEIFTVGDLLNCFPQKYIDRSTIYKINSLNEEMQYVQLRGQIVELEELGKGRSHRLEATFTDGTGIVRLVWFNSLKVIKKSIKFHTLYLLLGKPTIFNGTFNIVHPELDEVKETTDETQIVTLHPIYRVTENMRRNGLTSRAIEILIVDVLKQLGDRIIPETLPEYFIRQYGLVSLDEAIRKIHHPDDLRCLPRVEERLKFEELFYLQLNIVSYAHSRVMKYRGFLFKTIGNLFLRFYNEKLPFQLTGAQKKVIKEIRRDVRSGRQMNRLLQGDVGSGKTVVAVMTMLMALDNGYQACIMAPTEILAEQHYVTLKRMLESLGICVALLTSMIKGKRRQEVLDGIQDGSIHILVGTHAVLGDVVNFKNLGLAVIDEQHRFGVAQRSKLWLKNEEPPHILVMTATPIPRTLAMTVYGDLDVSVIDELPPGRKAIKTIHFYDNSVSRLVQIVRDEVAKGHQAYFVYPLIKENEKLDLKNLENGFGQICQLFPELKVGMLHGKMKNNVKSQVMKDFIGGKLNLLVSTTVIEVGVDVPNASVMVIENAERFGLAQLHQLRGRVGRGAEQSYCILSTRYELSETTRRRIEIMCETTDGFRIAEEDLKLRGPGDLEGTQQSGMIFDLKIAHLTRDSELMERAREAARRVVEEDPQCNLPQNQIMWERLRTLCKTNINWSAIS
jgi:ATP-dependent DNA helicase RecG